MANEFVIETGTAAAMQQVLKNVTAELDKQIAKQKQLVGPSNPAMNMFDDGLFSAGRMKRDKAERKEKEAAIKAWGRDYDRAVERGAAQGAANREERLATELRVLNNAGLKQHVGRGLDEKGEGRFFGAIPKEARKAFKLGKRIRSMSQISNFNPRADFNDVDETLGEARDLTGGLNRMARRYSMASRVSGGTAFGATPFSRAVGFAATPLTGGLATAGAGAAVALAAAYVGWGASIKFDTMAAENYRLKSDVDTKWMKATNSISSSYGNSGVNHKQVLQQVTKSLIDLDRTKNAAGRGVYARDLAFGPAVGVRIFSEFLGFGRSSSLETSASMSEDTAWGETKRWFANKGVWALGNDNYYISQAQKDKIIKDKSEQLEKIFDQQYRGAVDAAEMGDTASFRAHNDLNLLNQAPELRGKVEAVSAADNAGRIHRITEEAKMARRQFAFTQQEWKAYRVD